MKNFIFSFDQGKSAIKIIQPKNQSYNISKIIVVINAIEYLPWVVYSLNNAPNVSIPLLTTSPSLSIRL